MATSANMEIDPILKKAVRLLHSSNPNSATEMRVLLDELILQRFGAEKTLANTLSKRNKEQLEELESNFPGLVVTPPAAPVPKPEQVEEVINLTNSPGSNTAEEESNLRDFGDLNCCVCGEMMITATNRLIECSKCCTLYHQECHKPPITDEEASEDQEHNWQCDNCANKPSTSKAANIVTSAKEDTPPLQEKTKLATNLSRSSSPFYKQDSNVSTRESNSSSSSSKHHHHHHKSSHSSKSTSKHESGSKRKSHK